MNRQKNPSMRTMLLASTAAVLVMFAISAYVWTRIPAGEVVCTHWNAAGECDDHGSKFVGILLLPIVTVGMAGLFALIPRIEPRAAHLAQSSKAYAVIWAALLLTFLALHTILMLDILGYDAGIDTTMPILVGLMFVLIGGSLGHIRSNYLIGIRTPWTLSSELSHLYGVAAGRDGRGVDLWAHGWDPGIDGRPGGLFLRHLERRPGCAT